MKTNPKTLIVTPTKEDSRWVAISDSNQLLAEGKTPNDVFSIINKQDKPENPFLMFIPQKGVTYIF
jgi:late competence protein required for DNA uptake (superfamily II DNA/RNA helicase)